MSSFERLELIHRFISMFLSTACRGQIGQRRTRLNLTVGTEKRRENVVVLRELQRAIIYTRELSKQAIEDHVSTAFTVY
jgi:hypothetical protein